MTSFVAHSDVSYRVSYSEWPLYRDMYRIAGKSIVAALQRISREQLSKKLFPWHDTLNDFN